MILWNPRNDYMKDYRKKKKALDNRWALFYSTRNTAYKKKLEHKITLNDIVIPEYCPVLGLKLESHEKNSKPNSASVDRIDPNLGYIPGNIQVISHRANMLKNNMTFDEVQMLYEFMKNL